MLKLSHLHNVAAVTHGSADGWPAIHCTPLGFQGIAHMRQLRSCFSTSTSFDQDLPTWVAFASKKGGPSHRTRNTDDKGLVTEGDLQYKPKGFGEGKVYDTSLEEKLLEEIEREKAAQVAALQKGKKDATATKSSTSKPTSEHLATADGIKVWVGDLPKKRNIDRDLRSAFRHVPGLLDISPCVIGNKKTRDPICKGFGFLTFDTMDHAQGLISSFQYQSLSFGKVEKKVIFKLLKGNDAEVVPSEQRSSADVGRLRIREKGARELAGLDSNPVSVSFKNGGHIVAPDDTQETVHTEMYQSEEDVVDGESSCEEEDRGDDLNMDDEADINISVDFGDLPEKMAIRDGTEGSESNDISDKEKRIEELEKRLKKKLEAAGYGLEKGKRKENAVKARGFNSKGTKTSRQLSPKDNNVAAVMHGSSSS